jgi:hypothetical protein
VTADLVAFLRARLDEDERCAREAIEPSQMHPWGDVNLPRVSPEQVPDEVRGYLGGTWGEHFARHVPARVLADVQAKRAILAAYATQYEAARQDVPNPPEFSPYKTGRLVGLQIAIQAWASVYADHPDFDPAWQVSTTTGGGHPG